MTLNLLWTFIGLTLLQIILNIDNVIFVSILTSKLPENVKKRAQRFSLFISMILGVALILGAGMLTILEETIFEAFGHKFTWQSLIMVGGGIFLMYKSAKEIYTKIEGKHDDKVLVNQPFIQIVSTLAVINFVFSIDSTITAIGMTEVRWIQICSVLAGIVAIYAFFKPLNKYLDKHPSLKIQSISFLSLIGFSLFSDGLGVDIPKGYIYFAMFISFVFELVQIEIDKVKFKIQHKKEDEK